MVDPVAIPDRLEQAVGEAERHDALDRVLAEEMVDAEDLVLVQRAQDVGIELARRLQAVTERLFDHDAAPESGLAARGGSLSVSFALPSWSTTVPKKRSATAR